MKKPCNCSRHRPHFPRRTAIRWAALLAGGLVAGTLVSSAGSAQAAATPSKAVVGWLKEEVDDSKARTIQENGGSVWMDGRTARGALVLEDGRGYAFAYPSVGAHIEQFRLSPAERGALVALAVQEPVPSPLDRAPAALDSLLVFATTRETVHVLDEVAGFPKHVLTALERFVAAKPKQRVPLRTFLAALDALERDLESGDPATQWPGPNRQPIQELATTVTRLLERSERRALLPHERKKGAFSRILTADNAFLAVMQSSHKGTSATLVSSDGLLFTVTARGASASAARRTLTRKERARLAEAFNAQRFFEFPQALHNPDITDGVEWELCAATADKSHTSTNYLYNSQSYNALRAAFAETTNERQQLEAVSPESAEATLRAFAEELPAPDRRRIELERWLKELAALGAWRKP